MPVNSEFNIDPYIPCFIYQLEGKIIWASDAALKLIPALDTAVISEAWLKTIHQHPLGESFSLQIDDQLTIWVKNDQLADGNFLIVFLDFSERWQFEQDIHATSEELAEGLEQAEIYKDKFDEQSQNLIAILEKLTEANDVIIHHTERITKELEMASRLQTNMLPKEFPFSNHYKIASHYKPSQHLGGDFFDVIKISSSQMLVVIADVSGHGVSSSLITAMFKMTFQFYSSRVSSPAELFIRLNADLNENIDGNFVTSFCCLLDMDKNELTFANAGHPKMNLLSPGQSMQYLESTGMMLGLFDMFDIEERTVPFTKGDKLFLYTDGIVEAENLKNELYNSPRLDSALSKTFELMPEETCHYIFNDLVRFTQNRPFEDDVTMLCISRI